MKAIAVRDLDSLKPGAVFKKVGLQLIWLVREINCEDTTVKHHC